MNGTEALLTAICVRISEWLPDLADCSPHAGRFGLDELKRWAIKTPAVRVASLGVAEVEDSGDERSDAVLQLAGMVITRDKPDLGRAAAATAIVDRLILGIPRDRWGISGIGPARNLRAENLYSGQIDKTGVAIWGVLWRQTLNLGGAEALACPVPSRLYVGQSPGTGPFRRDDYDLLAGEAAV